MLIFDFSMLGKKCYKNLKPLNQNKQNKTIKIIFSGRENTTSIDSVHHFFLLSQMTLLESTAGESSSAAVLYLISLVIKK